MKKDRIKVNTNSKTRIKKLEEKKVPFDSIFPF